MKLRSLLFALAFGCQAFAENHSTSSITDLDLRPELVEPTRAFLYEKISADDFVRAARSEKARRPFNDEEKSYLQDLTTRLPAKIRQEVCPTITNGLCENSPVAANWSDVPVVAVASEPSSSNEKSWLGRNWGWLVAGAAAGFAVGALRGKRIQFHGAR